MTYYLIIVFSVIIILSYIFELTAKYTKIPGVILLILTGMFINYLMGYLNIRIPDLSVLLPVMGTLGLILIVLEGSLDLVITKSKKNLILSSISSSIVIFAVAEVVASCILVMGFHISLRVSLLNTIPLGIISSAVAIPSSIGLSKTEKEFVIYESSCSDIIGIISFDFILKNFSSVSAGIFGFLALLFLTIIVSVIFSIGLAYFLHKINHQVKFVIILTTIILVYVLTKLINLPSLLIVLIFGLVMNNNHFLKNKITTRYVDFEGFSRELVSFKGLTSEFTFIIRSFFFIMFGYYTSLSDLLNVSNLYKAVLIVIIIYLLRFLYLRLFLKKYINSLLFMAPRGLITILLFLYIPAGMSLTFINQGLITQVIFITILIMTFGKIFMAQESKVKIVPELNT